MYIRTETTKTVTLDPNDVRKAVVEWVRARWEHEIEDPGSLVVVADKAIIGAVQVTYVVK